MLRQFEKIIFQQWIWNIGNNSIIQKQGTLEGNKAT